MEQKLKHERIKLTEVNSHLTCPLCRGYFVDATTIVECLHSFCRSCIIRHLQVNSYCPICEVMINTAKPNIKPDKTLQDIVYKLVPGLFAREMARRRAFYKEHPEASSGLAPEARGLCTERIIFSPNDSISLSIEYTSDEPADWNKNHDVAATTTTTTTTTATSAITTGEDVQRRRYLQCPAMLRVEHLKKFVCNKYNVDTALYHVDILYKRVPLPDHYTLMDIAYIYSWKRNEPMKFFYRITDINHLAERFDYFEPGAKADVVQPPPPPARHKTNKSKPPKTVIADNNNKLETEIAENNNNKILVKVKEEPPTPLSETPEKEMSLSPKKEKSPSPKKEDQKEIKDEKIIDIKKEETPPSPTPPPSQEKHAKNLVEEDKKVSIKKEEAERNDIISIEKSQFLKSIELTAISNVTSPTKSNVVSRLPIVPGPSCTPSPSPVKPVCSSTTATPAKQLAAPSLSPKNPLPVLTFPCHSTPKAKSPPKRKNPKSPKEKPPKKPKLVKSRAAPPKHSFPNNISNPAVMQMVSNVNQQVSSVSKIVGSTDSKMALTQNQNTQLKSLFDSCKINIPSSLSITLTESKGDDDGSHDFKNNSIKPVQNYIEILKLPDNTNVPPSKYKMETQKRSLPPVVSKPNGSYFKPTSSQPPPDKSKCEQNGKETDPKDRKESKPSTSTRPILPKPEKGAQPETPQIRLSPKPESSFQKMFEEAIKKDDFTRTQVFPISQFGVPKSPTVPKLNPIKPKKTPDALDLSKNGQTERPAGNNKRNILEIAHQLSCKKAKMDTQNNQNCPNLKSSPKKASTPSDLLTKPPPKQNGFVGHEKTNGVRHVGKTVSPKAKPEKDSLTSSDFLEKYNITNLAQLNANLSQAQLAYQQAMIFRQFELQNRLQMSNCQSWLNNPNVLAHYENYVQSLKNKQLCGNLNKN